MKDRVENSVNFSWRLLGLDALADLYSRKRQIATDPNQ